MDTDIFTFVSRYFWAVGIVVAIINTAIKWVQIRPRMEESPELAPGYITLLRGFWIMATLPWIPMGIGIIWGNVPTIWHFLFPRSGNPYVLAFWASNWCWNIVMAYWILVGGGAKTLVTHPGFLRGNIKKTKWIKAWMLFALAGYAIATVIMFKQPLPTDSGLPGL